MPKPLVMISELHGVVIANKGHISLRVLRVIEVERKHKALGVSQMINSMSTSREKIPLSLTDNYYSKTRLCVQCVISIGKKTFRN